MTRVAIVKIQIRPARHLVPDALNGESYAGNESSATDRDHHSVDVVYLEPQKRRGVKESPGVKRYLTRN